MSILPRAVAAFTTAALIAACSSNGGPNVGLMSKDTLPNGTVVLHYGEFPVGEPAVVSVDLSLGEVEGDDNLTFGSVRGVQAGRDGTIYVLDAQAAEIRAFDLEGRFSHRVATGGAGPGEITQANGIVLVGDSILWVQDPGQWMMIGLTTAGEEVKRFPMHVLSYGVIWTGTVDNSGRVWKIRRESGRDPGVPAQAGFTDGRYHGYMVHFDPAAGVTDSVDLGEATSPMIVTHFPSGAVSYRSVPNHPRAITVVDPDGGLWRTTTGMYDVVRLEERGDTVLVIESSTPAPPVTDADRTEYVERVLQYRPDDRRIAEELASLMPETKPLITSLTVDDAGMLWVGRVAHRGGQPQFDVFDRDGDYHGTVELEFQPASYVPLTIRQNRLYTVVEDSFDVQFVVRSGEIRLFAP